MAGGFIFNIQRYAIHDGPGIRTTVFLKGCPLNCIWCHNPEGISPNLQHIKRYRLLNGCREWVEETVGRNIEASEVLEIVGQDQIFYEESGGGVTFSGGEPLQQPDFLLEMLNLCKKACIHTAVDTSGYAPKEVFLKVAANTDLLLFDIKTTDPLRHNEFAGAGNEHILENLRALNGNGPSVHIRIPVIPGFNNNREEMEEICKILLTVKAKIEIINLLPYHTFGRNKYEGLGLQEPPAFEPETTSVQMKEFLGVFEIAGFLVKMGS